MKPAQLAADIRHNLFGDRGTDLSAAMQYAGEVFQSLAPANIAARTALHVVMNTLANILDEMEPSADNPAAGLDLGQFTLKMDRAALDDIIDTRISMWFLNNVEAIEGRIESWISDNPQALEERIESWMEDNLEVEEQVKTWMDDNFDAEDAVRKALAGIDLRISVR